MMTPVKLREYSRMARDAAARETDPDLKHLWASHALTLAQLAEEIERREKARSLDLVA